MSCAFFHGFILALGLILPLGVQNLFVMQQGMLQPRLLQAAPAVVTAALCDTVLICCAVGGMSLVLLELAYLRIGLIALGSLFLFYAGICTDVYGFPGSHKGCDCIRPDRLCVQHRTVYRKYLDKDFTGKWGHEDTDDRTDRGGTG